MGEAHRQWRPRKEHLGEMVQFDGSHHDWFENGELSCLMVMIDDATGRRMARLSDKETTAGAMQLLWLWIERYGRPQSLYVDGKNVYITDREPTLEEQLSDSEPATVFERPAAPGGALTGELWIVPGYGSCWKSRRGIPTATTALGKPGWVFHTTHSSDDDYMCKGDISNEERKGTFSNEV